MFFFWNGFLFWPHQYEVRTVTDGFSLFLCIIGVEELWVVLEFWTGFWALCVSDYVFVVWWELGCSFILILVCSTFKMFHVFALCFLIILYTPSLNKFMFYLVFLITRWPSVLPIMMIWLWLWWYLCLLLKNWIVLFCILWYACGQNDVDDDEKLIKGQPP